MMTRVRLCLLIVAAFAAWPALAADAKVTKYCRFQAGDLIAYGVVEGDKITQLEGDLFGQWKKTAKTYNVGEVKLLAPTQPSQVLALAGNYKSHLKDKVTDPKFEIVQPFFKSPSCVVGQGADIVIPKGTNEVHYEAEMVIVIGKRCKNVPEDKALDYVLGVTAGNDVSARDWQKNDVQWWRAKGSDTFGPCGPFIVSGLNYDNLKMVGRLNGKVVQDTNTKEMIHNVAKQVSVISQHVTLNPGDLIFTGTSGETSAIKAGDEFEVELEGVGILKNKVTAAK
jgi:2-keto-4-pentenoate hydratase/2-oxohepta-3-ene-1,7-dioic acid hydratase in catechol pathway